MKAPFAAVPAAPAAVGIIGGIVLAQQGMWIVGAIFGAAAFVALFFMHRHYASFFALMLCIGSLLAYAHQPWQIPEKLFRERLQISGQVLAASERDNGASLIVEIREIGQVKVPPVKASVSTYRHERLPEIGAKITFKGKISQVPIEPAIPYDAYYPAWLQRQGINYTITSYGALKLQDQPSLWNRTINQVRDAMWNGIALSPIDGKCASFLVAAILGDRSFLLPTDKDAFRATGTAHVLALSGLHVGIIASLLGWLVFPLGWHRRGFYISLPIIMLLVWAYAVLTGMSASVVRAAVMLSLAMICTLFQRGSQPFNALCVAAVIILAFEPLQLFTPGFQLTFSAVITLLIFVRLIPGKLQRRPILYYCVMAIVVPVAAMLGTGLISAYYFHIFPLWFLLANVAVGLFVGPVLSIGFVLMLLTMAGWCPEWLGAIENWLFHAMDWCIAWVGHLNGGLNTGYFSAWTFVPYTLMIVLLGLAVYRYKCEQPYSIPLSLAAASLLITIGIMSCCRVDNAPQAELIITNGSTSAIVLRAADKPYFIPMSDPYQCKQNVEARLKEYLAIRCDRAHLSIMPKGVELGPFYRKGDNLIIGDKLMAIYNKASVQEINSCAEADYALIGPEFRGYVEDVVESCHPDTLVLAGEISPSRTRRFMREADEAGLPCINLLSAESFVRVFP